MGSKKIALVTGANRGIGLEICRQLAYEGVEVILTARNASAGRAVTKSLVSQGLDIHFHQLDVTDEASIIQTVTYVEAEFGRLDILVNNAGVLLDRSDWGLTVSLDKVRETMEINAYGALRLCQMFIPLMKARNYGRIVNVSSGLGALHSMAGGYPAYRLSKVAMNAMTAILADELKDTNILVNAMSPGWVKTAMGGENAPRPVDEGADTAIWLALLPDDGPTGGFFRDRAKIPW
ncbi:MAG: SDR family oxidoreductase [Gemmatimonadetes bacterium]|nr:MAG: SDR family oxidoreductase [Gemmatimonadota bacterium]